MEQRTIRPSSLVRILVIFLILALGLLVYHNSFRAPFLVDDYYTIVRNFPLRDLSRIEEIVSQSLFASAGQTSSYFRPLTQLTFALDYQLWGLHPAGYRLTNVALHLINAILIFFLAQRWLPLGAATFVALLFVVHPVNVQAIAYISSRSDPLFFFFSVLTLHLWTTSKIVLRPLCLFSFLLALLSKEHAVVTPVLILLIDLLGSQSLVNVKPILKRNGLWYLGFALVFLLYLTIRVGLLGYPLLMEKEASLSNVGVRLLLALKLLGSYLLLLFLPINLAFQHTVSLPQGLLEGDVAGPALLIIFLGYFGFKLWHKERSALLGLAWFLIAILPVLNLTLLNLPLMESWLYLPQIGLFVMAVVMGRLLLAGKGLPIALSCLVIFLLSIRTMVRSLDWRDPIKLFEKNAKLYPDANLAWSGLSIAYQRIGRSDASVEALKKALEIDPDRWYTHLSLARHYFRTNEDEKAKEEFLIALRLKPDSAWAHYFLGILYFRSGQWTEALESFKNSLSGKPHIPMLYHTLGATYLALGSHEAADEAFQKALQDFSSDPNYHAGAHIELGRLLKGRGKMHDARREFELALRFHPESKQAKEELASLR